MSSQPSLAHDSFGRRLRSERERRKIALASIAGNSKISVSLFEDLERDDLSRWPSGVFRRSFIRAYAQGVGLDPDAIARELVERFPDATDAPRVAVSAPRSSLVLRVTLAATSRFARGMILPSLGARCAAVACDATIVATLGLVMYAVLGSLWMPLCAALTGYYAGSILLLGNTPGVCLCAGDTILRAGGWVMGGSETHSAGG
ncbi:MAG: hypothetical protein DMF86_15590 [Acidobacteria bacterium]|nr:MAG: hypothetical protein DMF86_15590 [Acidobacteriota bacterium]